MSALICGSMAFDTIAQYQNRFVDAILPNQIHILSVSFLVPSLRHEYGGCAGNIAYTLKALGGDPLIFASIGNDSKDYMSRLDTLGISTEYIHQLEDHHTAQCFIITDIDNNQINAFHPGAMNEAHRFKIPQHTDIKIGIIAPDGKQGMIDHAKQMYQAGISYIFDPGQGLPMFDKEELLTFLEHATWLASNDYEAQMLCERSGLSLEAISKKLSGALFITLGSAGCEVWQQGLKTSIPPVVAQQVVDPTGCGDAFRAGLLYGLERGWPALNCAQLGNLLGSIKIGYRGTQNHQVPARIVEQFQPS